MATYYVNTNAAAGGDGTTQALTGANCAWDTVADVNAASFSAGDFILFNKGCTWREQLTVPSSGSSGSPITFGTYGTGATPIINGADLMTTWGATSGNFGDSTAPGTPAAHAADYIYYQKVTVARGGDATSINVYFGTTPYGKPTSGDIKCAIYTDSSNTPSALVANSQTDERAWSGISAGEYTAFTFSTNPTLTSATAYWIAVWTDQNYSRAKVAGGTSNWCNESKAYDTFPSTATAGTPTNYSDNDVYVTITLANIWKKTSVTTEPKVVVFDGTWGEYESSGINSLDTEKEWFWASDVLYVYTTGGDPDTQWASGIEVAQRTAAVTAGAIDYITFDGIDLRNVNQACFWLSSATDSWIIQNCTMTNAGANGVNGVTMTNALISTNTISYTSSGVTLSSVSDGNIIEYNDMSESRTTAQQAGGGGMMLYDSDSNIIRYNYFHDARLVSTSRQGNGIYLSTAGNCNSNEIYYNIFARFNDGIDISGDGNLVYNNTFYKMQYPQYHIDEPATNNVMKNNIFYDGIVNNFMTNTGNTPAANNTIENNCYYDPDNPTGSVACISWDATGETWGDMTWAAWVAHAKYDQNSIYTDPLFVDAANGDFTLQISSPCVDAGVDVGLALDYVGNTVGLHPDIGAYEHQLVGFLRGKLRILHMLMEMI